MKINGAGSSRGCAYIVFFIGYGLIVLFLWATGAFAHQAPSGMPYPKDCCSNDGKECAPVPDSAINEENGGYMVTLRKEDHPRLTGDAQRFFPYGNKGIKWSTDGKYHACGRYSVIFCVIVPPAAF